MKSVLAKLSLTAFLLAGVVLSHASIAGAATLDFESMPGGGTPVESTSISNQFAASFGITFANSDGTFPVMTQIGAPLIAFNSSFGDDTPAPSEGDGSFFLAISPLGAVADLIITYSTLQKDAGAVVLDIDQGEAWTIQAKDALNNTIDTVVLNTSSPNAGDALATAWAFHHALADIAAVRIVYTGSTAPTGTGAGFDNFTAPVPEPSTSILVGLGILGLGLKLRRR